MKLLLNINKHLFEISKRYLKNEIRLKLEKNRVGSAKKLALDYFDFYYSPMYGLEWNRMRLGLLTNKKYIALVNNYNTSINETLDELNKSNAFNLIDFVFKYKMRQQEQLEEEQLGEDENTYINTINDYIKISKDLKVYTFDTSDTSKFDEPKMNSKKLFNYYCMNGASVLPVLALNINENDTILDLCASPGGKTLLMLQTLLPLKIVCNDKSLNRIQRLKNTLEQYLTHEDLLSKVDIINDNINIDINNKLLFNYSYDKVLVDVPCTNDRHSLHTNDNNIFSKRRTQEREQLPQIQKNLLMQAIDLCKLGGSIVYSTCTLSPIQNEGIIAQCLDYYDSTTPTTNRNMNINVNNNKQEFTLSVEPLDYLKNMFAYFFDFSSVCKTGALCIPTIQKNFGPIYICKLNKLPKI